MTFPLSSGSMAGKADADPMGNGSRTRISEAGMCSVIWNVRGLKNAVGARSMGNLPGSKVRVPEPSRAARRSNASSNGTGTPSTSTTGQFRRMPEDLTLKVPAAWPALTAAEERMALTSVPFGTLTVQTSQIGV